MDLRRRASFPSTNAVRCCDCGCICSLTATPHEGLWVRTVKRKYDEYEEGNHFQIPGFDFGHVARVGTENERDALRDMVNNKQLIIDELSAELDEERNASSSAANEAISMILRLQREKAAVQMDATQFKRFAEEKMSHDAEELTYYDEMLYKKEQAIQALTCEIQAYKHRMMSFGLTEGEAEGMSGGFSRNQSFSDIGYPMESPTCSYPPLRCSSNEMLQHSEYEEAVVDIEKYPFEETPHSQDHLRNLEYRMNQMDSPKVSGTRNYLDKAIVGPSYFGSGSENGIDSQGLDATSFKKLDCVAEELRISNDASDVRDDMSDRVYTIDPVHHGKPCNDAADPKFAPGVGEGFTYSPKGSPLKGELGEPDIKKLYMRLQALEADRESLRHTVMSMQTDKAQLVLLKEIAQHLCKDMSTERNMMPVKKPLFHRAFSFLAAFKWIFSLIFWRRKASPSKYSFGFSLNNAGLLCLLEKGSASKHGRCITSTQVRSCKK